jgi:hypothetical protein
VGGNDSPRLDPGAVALYRTRRAGGHASQSATALARYGAHGRGEPLPKVEVPTQLGATLGGLERTRESSRKEPEQPLPAYLAMREEEEESTSEEEC